MPSDALGSALADADGCHLAEAIAGTVEPPYSVVEVGPNDAERQPVISDFPRPPC
jgi:hypothetical protein